MLTSDSISSGCKMSFVGTTCHQEANLPAQDYREVPPVNEKEVAAKLSLDQIGFLDLCAGLELKVAELYHYFEELFAEDLPFSLLWKKTAHEEENHAEQFNLGIRLKGIGMKGINADVSKTMLYLHKVEAFLEQSIASRPSQEEALTLSIKLEEQLATLHMSSIVIFEDSQMQVMFEAMMKSDRGHISMLRDFLDKLKAREGNYEA